jgi:predicted aspartyl protease
VKITGSVLEYRFIFDTGAPMTVVDSGVAYRLGFRRKSRTVVRTVSGSRRKVPMVAVPSISIKDLTVKNVAAAVMDLSGLSREMGVGVDGVLGANVLRHSIVRTSYAESKVWFYDTAYSGGDSASAFSLKSSRAGAVCAMTKAMFNETVEYDIAIDYGFDGWLAVPRSKAAALAGENAPVLASEGQVLRDICGWTGASVFRVKKVVVGSVELRNVPAFVVDSRCFALGREVLRHTVPVLDYPRNRGWIEPAAGPGAVVDFSGTPLSAGMVVGRESVDSVAVKGLWPNSPAAMAGIEAGYSLVAFNGVPVGNQNVMAMNRAMNFDDSIGSVSVEVEDFRGERKKHILQKKALLP